MIDPDYFGDVLRGARNLGLRIPETPVMPPGYVREATAETLIENAMLLRGNLDLVAYTAMLLSSVNALLFLAACSGIPFDRVWEVGENRMRKPSPNDPDTVALFRAQLGRVLGVS